MTVGINHFILIGAISLGLGIYLVASHKNILRMLMGVCMIFGSSILNFAAFSGFKAFNTEGQIIVYVVSAISIITVLIGALLAYNYYSNNSKSLNINNDYND